MTKTYTIFHSCSAWNSGIRVARKNSMNKQEAQVKTMECCEYLKKEEFKHVLYLIRRACFRGEFQISIVLKYPESTLKELRELKYSIHHRKDLANNYSISWKD